MPPPRKLQSHTRRRQENQCGDNSIYDGDVRSVGSPCLELTYSASGISVSLTASTPDAIEEGGCEADDVPHTHRSVLVRRPNLPEPDSSLNLART